MLSTIEKSIHSESQKKPLLQIGSRGEAVKELQDLLRNWGYYANAVDGIFDQDVEKAVKAFQHQFFLTEDGIVGTFTWQCLHTGEAINLPLLKRGSQGRMVKTVQMLLESIGDYQGEIDSEFGLLTEAAVKTFQQRFQLKVDGIVGAKTWSALSSIPH